MQASFDYSGYEIRQAQYGSSDVLVPVYGEDESWFDDALFLGDSRMVGLSQYARLGEADYFADVGLTVFQLFSQTAADIGFERTDLASLLSNRQYGKIYIMLGLNEAGYPLDSLENEFRQDIEQIQALQPEAVIYLLQVYGVSREKAAAVSYLTPEHLQEINAMIASLCDGTQVRCLDPGLCTKTRRGISLRSTRGDGVHPYGKYGRASVSMALPAGGLAWDIGRHPGAGLSELFEIKGADAPSGQQLLFIWGKRRDHARYVGK